MTDRDLLEKAARAAGYDVHMGLYGSFVRAYFTDPNNGLRKFTQWNPLEDDGDALRLAVKLGIDLKLLGMTCNFKYCSAKAGSIEIEEEAEYTESDPMVAVRRAIVRVAAEMEIKS